MRQIKNYNGNHTAKSIGPDAGRLEKENCLKFVIISLNFVIKTLLDKVLLHIEIMHNEVNAKGYRVINFFLLLAHSSFSKKTDSTQPVFHFKGAVTVTNKGPGAKTLFGMPV